MSDITVSNTEAAAALTATGGICAAVWHWLLGIISGNLKERIKELEERLEQQGEAFAKKIDYVDSVSRQQQKEIQELQRSNRDAIAAVSAQAQVEFGNDKKERGMGLLAAIHIVNQFNPSAKD